MNKSVNGADPSDAFGWDIAEGLPLLLFDSHYEYIYGPGGMVLEQVSSANEVSYLHGDQLGSIRLVTDAGGSIANSYEYDAYGARTEMGPGSIASAFGYTGEYTDEESGLVYLRARYYDPATQQFLTRDPIEAITEQPYAYVKGDPVDEVDPLGLGGPRDNKDRVEGAGAKRPTRWAIEQARAMAERAGLRGFYNLEGKWEVIAKNAPKLFTEYEVVPYRFRYNATKGLFQRHHGLMDRWAQAHKLCNYDPDTAPTITLTSSHHTATYGVYNSWRADIVRRTGTFDWTKVSARDIVELSERMFDAAKVPYQTRQEYYTALNRYLYGGR